MWACPAVQVVANAVRSGSAVSGSMILQRDILIAIAATALGGALALEPQRLAGVGMGRQGQHDAAGNGGNIDLAAEDRFAQRNRHVDADIVAVAGEDGMRADMDLDQRIAGRAAA